MTAIRLQGRPRRGNAEVGRDKIISRLQVVYRSGGDFDQSRKTLAALAGVTPALISYYFSKKELLLEAISQPVMQRYREDMEIIVSGRSTNEVKLNELVNLLIGLYSQDGGILDIYMDVKRKAGRTASQAQCEVTKMTFILSDFFSTWRKRPGHEGFDAAVLQGVVWGMCRFATRIEQKTDCGEDWSPHVDHVVRLMSPPASAFA